jgi:hypothetical protein
VNSYSGQVDYEDIPFHRLNNGVRVSLRDVLDFRPVQGADGTYTGTGARIMQLPEPQSSITTDVVYYLPRSDVIFIDDQAQLKIYEGIPSLTPITPEIPGNALRLFEVNYNPYTLNSSDYTFREIRNKGYKMTDIARLEQRIEDVEEAITLSLLELDAANLEVLDSNGVNRLKSGFIADNFNDFRLTDLQTPEERSGIDVRAKEMGPLVNKNAIRMVYDSDASLNTIRRGDNIYMKYEEYAAVTQTQSSGVQEINPFDAYATIGRVVLSPSSDDWIEINKLADLINEETIRKTETRNVTQYRTGGGGGGGGKIVCTAMNESYGFGSFRQKIWLEQSRGLPPEYQVGYHAIGKPLIRYAYKSQKPGHKTLRKIIEHLARRRTADIWKQRRGKRDYIGATERAIIEPICYVTGWVIMRAKGL